MLYILYINQNALVVSGWWSSEDHVAGKVHQENTLGKMSNPEYFCLGKRSYEDLL